jgi:hypothetical protein
VVVIDCEDGVGRPLSKTLAEQPRERRRINLTCVLRAKVDSKRLSSARDDLLYRAREIGSKSCDIYSGRARLVPGRRTFATLAPLPRERSLPVAGWRDEQDDSRGRLVQQPRQARPLDDVALRSDEFGGRFADGGSPERNQIPLPQD